jgi:hypothetical protein
MCLRDVTISSSTLVELEGEFDTEHMVSFHAHARDASGFGTCSWHQKDRSACLQTCLLGAFLLNDAILSYTSHRTLGM